MPLSNPERASCFEIVSGFWAGATASITNGFGITLSMSDLSTLTADINSRLDTVSADETACTKIQALIVKWDEIADENVEINNGSIGNINGLMYSTKGARDRIREQVHTYIPVFHMLEAIQKRNNQVQGSNGMSFGIGR